MRWGTANPGELNARLTKTREWEQGRRLNPLLLVMSQWSYHILYPAIKIVRCLGRMPTSPSKNDTKCDTFYSKVNNYFRKSWFSIQLRARYWPSFTFPTTSPVSDRSTCVFFASRPFGGWRSSSYLTTALNTASTSGSPTMRLFSFCKTVHVKERHQPYRVYIERQAETAFFSIQIFH